MRILPRHWLVVVSLVTAVNASAAQPDQDPRLYEQSENGKFLHLFDSSGLPMLQVSAPTYLHLGERRKLRSQTPGFGDDPGGNAGGGGGGNGARVGDGGGGDGGGGDGGGGGGNKPPRSVPEPATLLMLMPAAALAIRKYGRGKASRF